MPFTPTLYDSGSGTLRARLVALKLIPRRWDTLHARGLVKARSTPDQHPAKQLLFLAIQQSQVLSKRQASFRRLEVAEKQPLEKAGTSLAHVVPL